MPMVFLIVLPVVGDDQIASQGCKEGKAVLVGGGIARVWAAMEEQNARSFPFRLAQNECCIKREAVRCLQLHPEIQTLRKPCQACNESPDRLQHCSPDQRPLQTSSISAYLKEIQPPLHYSTH